MNVELVNCRSTVFANNMTEFPWLLGSTFPIHVLNDCIFDGIGLSSVEDHLRTV